MNRTTAGCLFVLSTCLSVVAQKPRSDAELLATACNQFASDLNEQLAKAGKTTASPASIAIALLMLLPGARGDTAVEIATLLHLPDDLRGERLAAAVKELLATVGAPTGATKRTAEAPTLRITNDLWVRQGLSIVSAYETVTRDAFGASPNLVDFAADPEAARRRINDHVAKATNGRIQDLLSPRHVTESTGLVLTNALWFKAAWVHSFFEDGTKDAPFTLADGTKIDVATMHQTDYFGYSETESWQRLSMSFRDSRIVCEILLPRPSVKLAEVEGVVFRETHLQAEHRRVRVALPRFKVEASHELKEPLQALGVRAAFSAQRADFAGITTDVPLFVDHVVHRTWIAVDEKGAEAAAATAVGMTVGSKMPPDEPVAFTADRPFAFVLRDRPTGLVLFVGRVTDPRTNAN